MSDHRTLSSVSRAEASGREYNGGIKGGLAGGTENDH